MYRLRHGGLLCFGRWSKIASHFPGRTDNEIKNHWNTRIKKRLRQMGLDPVTHKPIEQMNNETTPVSHDDQAMISDCLVTKKADEKRDGEDEIVAMDDEKSDLLSNYEMLCGSLDLGSWINQLETNTASYSSSLSADESNNVSFGESSSVQDMDSVLSWGSFNHLVDDIFFMENCQQCNIPTDSVFKYC